MTASALLVATCTPPRGALERKIAKTGIFQRVLVCEQADEVLPLLQNERIDLICWAFTPEEIEFRWIEEVKRHPDLRDIPLLVFSKAANDDPRLAELEEGGCEPVKFVMPTSELKARIQELLKRTEQICQLRHRRAQMAQMALNDPMTGLGNRTSFDLRLRQELSLSRRNGTPLALLLIDLDHFQWISDCYGRQASDTIIRSVAQVFKQTLRVGDLPCRYSGEEFAIILPGMTLKNAEAMADRLHKAIGDLSADLWQNRKSLSISIGLTCFDGSRRIGSGEMLAEADSALFQAKESGRKRTEIFEPSTPYPAYFDNAATALLQAHT